MKEPLRKDPEPESFDAELIRLKLTGGDLHRLAELELLCHAARFGEQMAMDREKVYLDAFSEHFKRCVDAEEEVGLGMGKTL